MTYRLELLTRAVEKARCGAMGATYIRRWLESPVRKQTGEMVAPDRGTPQGGDDRPAVG
ncbi:MAG: hypothetical protein IPP36_07640 [Nitrosomonadales bacterium]|nr:hypothetical protein [Nitrosomonadales bacterium]